MGAAATMGKVLATADPQGRDGEGDGDSISPRTRREPWLHRSAEGLRAAAPWGRRLGPRLRVTAMGKMTETAAAQGRDGEGEGDYGSVIGKPPACVAPRSWR